MDISIACSDVNNIDVSIACSDVNNMDVSVACSDVNNIDVSIACSDVNNIEVNIPCSDVNNIDAAISRYVSGLLPVHCGSRRVWPHTTFYKRFAQSSSLLWMFDALHPPEVSFPGNSLASPRIILPPSPDTIDIWPRVGTT